MERVLVCGGRTYNDSTTISLTLASVLHHRGIAVLIHGGAEGADKLAAQWAWLNKIKTECYPISREDWRVHGKAAGPIRNQQMLDEGKPSLVVCFVGGKGTADMRRRALKAGVEIMDIDDVPSNYPATA